jgi:(p)ppGpp synthase/HD superfamily hydrolase
MEMYAEAERGGFEPMSPEEADELAARLLGGSRTKLGGLHIDHARRVAARVGGHPDPRSFAAALLHDVLEKTGTSAAELRRLTGDEAVVDLVDVLTRRGDENEEEYLGRCALDPVALLVKRSDLADKLTAPDATVSDGVAEMLRAEAAARLELLEQIARRCG